MSSGTIAESPFHKLSAVHQKESRDETLLLPRPFYRLRFCGKRFGRSVVARKMPDRPPPFTNQFGMKFGWVPPGTFMMGSPQEERDRQSNEVRRKVT